MASNFSSVDIVTQQVTRDLLAQIAGNHRVVKLLENITQDVSQNIPAGMDQLQEQAETVKALADLSASIALKALEIAASMQEGPPVLPSVDERTQEPSVSLPELIARLTALEQRVGNIEEGPAS